MDLKGKRNKLILRVKKFGDSDRQVGSRALLSHTAVQNIVTKRHAHKEGQ